jgi:hypothetical protein
VLPGHISTDNTSKLSSRGNKVTYENYISYSSNRLVLAGLIPIIDWSNPDCDRCMVEQRNVENQICDSNYRSGLENCNSCKGPHCNIPGCIDEVWNGYTICIKGVETRAYNTCQRGPC